MGDLQRHDQGVSGAAKFKGVLNGYPMALESFKRLGYTELGPTGRSIRPADFRKVRLSIAIQDGYDKARFDGVPDWSDDSATHWGMQFRVNIAPH